MNVTMNGKRYRDRLEEFLFPQVLKTVGPSCLKKWSRIGLRGYSFLSSTKTKKPFSILKHKPPKKNTKFFTTLLSTNWQKDSAADHSLDGNVFIWFRLGTFICFIYSSVQTFISMLSYDVVIHIHMEALTLSDNSLMYCMDRGKKTYIR